MLTKAETGRMGETAVCTRLENAGYTIVKKNYRIRGGEIDIIARNDRYVIFVEVKTRAAGSMISGAEAVDIPKQRRIVRTAAQWLVRNPIELQPRFDVAEIVTDRVGSDKIVEINYIADAFGGEVCSEIF